ncbi:ribbon-helix-helix domain-containing protein [Edaphobacter albus]|uniref:ribbon-helix-helix domain-containing protein n=1 Tax=Edaphobacter sp. 4G125 TaxID=2763071 RepID=UPI001646D2B6|nr:CopG family transcriptional regulator [Edaphobacter sp. 4G125]
MTKKRDNQAAVRLTDAEMRLLDKLAAKRGLPRSAMLRLAFLDYAHRSGELEKISGQLEGR